MTTFILRLLNRDLTIVENLRQSSLPGSYYLSTRTLRPVSQRMARLGSVSSLIIQPAVGLNTGLNCETGVKRRV